MLLCVDICDIHLTANLRQRSIAEANRALVLWFDTSLVLPSDDVLVRQLRVHLGIVILATA